MFNFAVKDIPFCEIRHSDLVCYVKEGFGGAHLRKWPVYSFFKKYLTGSEDAAQREFEQWYYQQLSKYSSTPKSEGGMYKGSLYKLIEQRCQMPFSEADEIWMNNVISERVSQRFSLLTNIKEQGYDSKRTEQIAAIKKDSSVYLLGGHHRAAALLALGEEKLPDVLVFPRHIYKAYIMFRNMKIES